MLTLYYSPGTISVAVAITLNEAGLDFEPVKVDFATAEQTKREYHKINPKGRVPALVSDGHVLTETGAILDYIGAIAPAAGLIPADPVQAARMREMMYYLASTMHVNHAHEMRGSRWADKQSSWDDMASKVAETMTASSAYLEANCLKGPFVLGDTFSLADPYLYVVANWLPGDGVRTEDFPKLNAFMSAMSDRASVRAVRAAGIM
jgi:glutathione S-transferase